MAASLPAVDSPADDALQIRAAGGLEIVVGDREVTNDIPIKAALLIAYLADHGQPVSRSSIAGLLWSDLTEERARANMRVTLTRARAVLGERLRGDRTRVWLEGPVGLDTHLIEHGTPEEASRAYRGDYLAGLDGDDGGLFDDWLQQRRQTLHTAAMRQLKTGCDTAIEHGDWAEARSFAERLVGLEPWNEGAHRRRIRAIAATDGRAAALIAVQECTERLAADLGVEPDAETLALAQAVDAGPSVEAGPIPHTADHAARWCLLGDISVEIDGSPHDPGSPQRRSVMAALALAAPGPCTLAELEAAVWGDDPPTSSKQSIRRYIRELRASAELLHERIEAVPSGFRLAALPGEIDAARATELIDEARAAAADEDLTRAIELQLEAISLWTGPSLSGATADGRLRDRSRALDELRLGATEDLLEAELALGHHRAISSRVEAFAAEHPMRERAWASLMLVRYRCGRQADALDAYETLKGRLAAEGVEPSPIVRAVLRQIVEQADAPGRRHAGADATVVDPWTVATSGFDVPLPAPLRTRADTALVGRAAELDDLAGVVGAALEGRSTTAFVSGEPGIGKTRLLADVAAAAADRGVAVLYGRCDDGPSVPYRAWRDALADLVDHVPPHVARRHFDRFGPSLRLLMPTLTSSGTGFHAEAPDDDLSQQQLLFEATTSMLAELAARRPLLLAIDDLQWAETSTLALLRHVARRIDAPVAIIALYRSTEVGDALAELVGAVETGGRGRVVPLDALDRRGQIDLVEHMVSPEDHARAETIASAIAAEAGGNPFFFKAILQSLLESGGIEDVGIDHDDRPTASSTLPATVQRAVRQRAARLGPDVAGLLRTAAILGREFDLEVLSTMVGTDDSTTLDLLEVALAAGLVTDATTGRDRFAFPHDLLHHSLAEELTASRRGRLHEKAADALIEVHGPDVGDRVGEVAGHLLAADEPRRDAETIRWCHDAGSLAAARHAPDEAAIWYERVLVLLERSPQPDPALLGRVLVDLGTQQRNAGDPTHRATLIRAGELAITNGDVDTLVGSALANSRGMNAHVWELDDGRIGILRAALDELGTHDSPARAELLASLANEQWDADHEAETASLYTEAMAMARRVDDPATLARVLIRVSRARNFRLPRAELASAAAELRDLVHRAGAIDPLLSANSLTTMLNTGVRLGMAAETYEAIAELNDAAARLPLPMFTLGAHLGRGLDAGLRGDIAAYEAEATATYQHTLEIEDEEAGFIFEGQLFHTAYMRGDLAPILDLSIQIMNDRPEVALYRAAAALIHVAAGLTDEARRLLDAELDLGIEASVDMFEIQALTTWANAAASLGHERACERLTEVLEHLSTETSGHLVFVGEPIALSLGRMATVLRRFDDADAYLDTSAQLAEDFDGGWIRAMTLACRAQMLVRRGAEGDHDRAHAVAARALEIASAQDYRGVVAMVEDLTKALPGRPG